MHRLSTSWISTLSKLGFKRRRRRPGVNCRRPAVEQLETREYLTTVPWQGADLAMADFDGDGYRDRLSTASDTNNAALPSAWSVDTRGSTSATPAATEAWRVTRGDGAPPSGLPQQVRVGDFNGDGRDDLLGRHATGPWYVIQSRGQTTVGTANYAGEFYISLWAKSGITANASDIIVGDFNGDGRDDLAAFEGPNKLRVARSLGDKFDVDEIWSTTALLATATFAGDFNGDQRDDLWLRISATQRTIAISDGTRFNTASYTTPAINWSTTLTFQGDFDGDGAKELLGWNGTAGRWDVLDYDARTGASVQTTWGTALGVSSTLRSRVVGDVNRDGRDDLVAYETTVTPGWKVALSQLQPDGTSRFVVQSVVGQAGDWNRWFDNWDWGPNGTDYVSLDGPYQDLLDKFSTVYNDIKLEYHPGLMKGPTATSETKAGNDWEQAALLDSLLDTAGFNSFIARGKRRASQSETAAWLGAKDINSAELILKTAFDPLADRNNTYGTFTFLHTVVAVLAPDASGLNWVFIDPSWKFRDLGGVSVHPSGGSGLTTSFDDFAKQFLFTTKDGKFVKSQLPIEAYEDQVMARLVGTPALRGNSLANVPYDGPIIARQFDQIPTTPVVGAAASAGTGHIDVGGQWYFIFNSIVDIAEEAAKWAHRVNVKITSTHTSTVVDQTLVIPKWSLDTTKIWYSTTGAATGNVFPKLTIFGQDFLMGQVPLGSDLTITITHYDPSLGYTPTVPKVDTYVRKAGDYIIVSLDADQYSSTRLVQMQAVLNTALATVGPGYSAAIDKDDIDDLLAYTGAKYWHDYNRDLRTLTGLSHTIDVQQRVGSGLITSGSNFAVAPHLSFQLVPDGMNLDLKNWVMTPIPLQAAASSIDLDVLRLAAFNASALENSVLEEVINAESISTVKGIQRFLDNANTSNDATAKVIVVEHDPSGADFYSGGVPRFRVTQVATKNGAQTSGLPMWWSEQQVKDNLQLDASVENTVISNLRFAGALNRIWVPSNLTVIPANAAAGAPGWTGAVYIYESIGNTAGSSFKLQYLIQKQGSSAGNGGYRGGEVLPPNPKLQPGAFLNQTHAGDPVNVANGNMFRDEVDFRFANPGLPLDFARHYDSQNTMDVGLGVGWVHSFTNLLYQEPGQTAGSNKRTWLRGNGERHVFANDTYEVPNTLYGGVEKSGSNLSSYTDKDGTTYFFQSVSIDDSRSGKRIIGRVNRIQDASGNALTISYESDSSTRVKRVASVNTPTRFLDFTYNVANFVQVWHVVDGRAVATWTYMLDLATNYGGPGANNIRLVEVQHASQSDTVTRYSYRTTGPSATKGLMETIVEPNGESHTYEYYANGRVFRVTDGKGNKQAFNYNQFRSLTEFTNELGNVETYIHQDNGLLVKQIHADRSRLEYTWGGNASTPSPTNPDEEFLMRSSTDEVGAVEKFFYYQPGESHTYRTQYQGVYRPGELKESIAKDGLVTRYEYWTPSATGDDRHHSEISKVIVDPTGSMITTSYARDNAGRPTAVIDAAGNVAEYTYNANGLLASQTLPKGVSGPEVGSWEILSSNFEVSGDTLSVQLLTGLTTQRVVADAIRIDRFNNDGDPFNEDVVFTRIADNESTGVHADFRNDLASGTHYTSVGYGGDFTYFTGVPADQVAATWTFADLLPGTYRISATWFVVGSPDPTTTYRITNGLPGVTPPVTVSNINQAQAPDDFRSHRTVYEYDSAGNMVSAVTEGLPATRRAYDRYGNVVYEQDPTGTTRYNEYDIRGRLLKTSIVDPKTITFTGTNIQPYHGPGGPSASLDHGQGSPHADGKTLHLNGDSHKVVGLNYSITANTILEFDFESTQLGEVHGIGVTHSPTAVPGKAFVLAGTNTGLETNWTNDFKDYVLDTSGTAGNGKRHYRIPIGQYVTGFNEHLMFVNSDDSAPVTGISYFSNVRLFEATATAPGPQIVNFTSGPASNVKSYAGDLDPDSWQVLDNGNTLHLFDGARKAVEVSYHVNRNTALDFDFEAAGQLGQVHGIGISNVLNASTAMSFAVAGTLSSGFQPEWNWDFKNYNQGQGKKHFSIPIGKFLAPGTYTYLAFVNYDADSQPEQGNSYFSNVKLSEPVEPVSKITFPTRDAAPTVPINLQSYLGDGSSVSVEVQDSGNTLSMTGNNRKAVGLNYYVTADTVLEFDFQSAMEGFVQGIGIVNGLTAPMSKGFILTGTVQTNYEPEWTRVFDNYVVGSGVKHYRIKLGEFLKPGLYEYLVLLNADWQAPFESQSTFKNIRVYDPVGVATTTYAHDAIGRVISTTDALGRTATNRYDGNGRLTRQTFADGTFTEHEYDAAGNCIAITDELDRTTRFVYDDRNRLIQTIFADGSSTRTRYDGAGRTVESTDELGRVTRFTYDEEDRLLTTEHFLEYAGQVSDFILTINRYDHLGRLIRTTDAEGQVTVYDHDRLGRVVETRVLDDGNLNATPVALTTTKYDANGQVAEQVTYDVSQLSAIPNSYLAEAVDFDASPIQNYQGFPNGVAEVEDGGATLRLRGDSRKAIAFDYTFTSNSILEFDFEVKAGGSIHGIGITSGVGNPPHRVFKLEGWQPFDYPNFTNWDGNYQYYTIGVDHKRHYRIPIGQFVTSGFAGHYLAFYSNGSATTETLFSNVGVYENEAATFNFSSVTFLPIPSVDGTFQASAATPQESGRTVYLTGNAWKALPFSYTVTPETTIEFDFKSTDQGAGHGLGFLPALDHHQFEGIALLGSLPPLTLEDYLGYEIGDGWRHYIIPIGKHVASGQYQYLGLINRAQGSIGGNSYFSDVVIYEVSATTIVHSDPDATQVVTTAYDAIGRPVKVTHADGTSTSTIYDAVGRVRYTFDELERKTELKYDNFGRLERTISPDPDGPSGAAVPPYTRYVRDSVGNVVQEWDFFAAAVPTNVEHADKFVYDARNRLVTTHRKDNTRLDFWYDVGGQLVATADGLRNSTYTVYDDRGRVVEERLADPDGGGGQFAPVTTNKYDAVGNVIASTDALGNTTTFAYDSLNRLRKESRNETIIADNSNVVGDVEFSASQGAVSLPNDTSYYGGDFTYLLDGSGRYFQWTFNSLPAGQYKISISSLVLSSTADGVGVEILNTTPPISIPLSQLAPSPDFRTVHGNVEVAWHVLKTATGVPYSVTVQEEGQSLSVRLAASGATGAVLADAVRIDRVVSRHYEYDKNGNLTKDIDTRTHFTEYAYDELGRQTSVSVDPDRVRNPQTGAVTLGPMPALVTESKYDGYGNLIATINRRDLTISTDDRTNIYKYDRRNRLIEEIVDQGDVGVRENVTTKYEYDAVGNRTLVIDALDHETVRRYDNLNRLIDEEQNIDDGRPVDFIVLPTNPTPQAYHTGLDGANGVASVAAVWSDGSAITLAGNAWKFMPVSYVVKHNTVLELDVQSDWAAVLSMIGFDTDNVLTGGAQEQFFELGGVSSFGGIFKTNFRREDRPDGMVRVHIPIGQYLTDSDKTTGLTITRLVFANHDTRAGLAEPDRGWTTFANIRLYESDEVRTVTTYDARGNVEKVHTKSDPRNITTRYEYDRLDRQTRRILDDGGSLEQKRVYITTYDAAGNVLVERNDTAGTETIHQYDRLNRLTRTTLPDPDNTPATFNGLVTERQYDVGGNVIKEMTGAVQHSIGSTTWVTYLETTRAAFDSQGQVVSAWDGNGDETRYRYDSEGNLKLVIDAEQNVTKYTYDGLNRLRTETITALVGTTSTDLTRTYEYDKAGNLWRVYDRENRIRKFTYDTLDRRIQEEWLSAPNPTTGIRNSVRLITWQYDKLGRVTKQADGYGNSGQTHDDLVDTFQYDGLGRLIEQTNYDPADPGQGSTSGVPRVRQAYDYSFVYFASSSLWGERTRRVENRRETSGVMTAIGRTDLYFDRLGRLADQHDTDADAASGPVVEKKEIFYAYDAAGNLDSLTWHGNYNGTTWANVAISDFAYDQANRLTSITHNLATDIVHAYGYDNASRVTSFNTGSTTRGYGYDDAGQLTSKTGGTGESYGYDDNGNRVTAGSQTVVTGLANRLTSDGAFNYFYDKEGNLIEKRTLDNFFVVASYTWDHRNRLVSATDWLAEPESRQVTYTYNADGQRVKRTEGEVAEPAAATAEYFVYNGDDIALRFNHAGQLTHRHQYGPATDQMLVDEVFTAAGQSDEVLWQLGDQQGTIRDVADDTAALRRHVDYDSVGRITDEQAYLPNGTPAQPGFPGWVDQFFYYQGQAWDPVAKLYDFGRRPYDPHTGRFPTADPTGFAGGDANLYRAFGNSYPNATDPDGTTQQGNPLNNLFSGYSGGGVLPYTPTNQFLAAAGISATAPTYRDLIDYNVPLGGGFTPQQVSQPWDQRGSTTPISPSGITPEYISSGAARREMDDSARRYAQGAVDYGTWDQAFSGQFALTMNNVAENSHPMVGQLYALDALTDRNASTTQKVVATGFGLLDTFLLGKASSLRGTTGTVVRTESRAAVEFAESISAPNNSLNILNREFTPDGRRVLQNLTNQQNALLGADLSRAARVLTAAEQIAAAGHPGIAKAQYGNAIERLVAAEIEDDALLKSIFRYNTTGKGPDFFGRGHLEGQIYDITTPGQVPAHLARPYGHGLNTITYERPVGFP